MTEPSITEKVPLTAKEKAEQLADKFSNKSPKECARICALELFFYNNDEEKRQWWIDVINEIENL